MRQKSIQALAIYEMKIKAMEFEETPLPPPPYATAATVTASGSKKIHGIFRDLDVIMTNVRGMDVDDNDGEIEDLIAEILNLMKRIGCSGLGLNNMCGMQLWV